MTVSYLPTEVFNIIKDYAGIDAIKHKQKKYMKLLVKQIRHDKWGIYGFDMEEARMVKSKIHRWGGEYLYGYEELHEQGIMNMNDMWEEVGIEPAETGIYRNDAWNNKCECCDEYAEDYDFAEEIDFQIFLENQECEYLEYLDTKSILPKKCLIKL